jgi:hypothetical protein
MLLLLVAESLEIAFTHPSTQQQLHISMPEPQRFYTMRQQLQNRWRKSQQWAQEEAGDDIKSTASTAATDSTGGSEDAEEIWSS